MALETLDSAVEATQAKPSGERSNGRLKHIRNPQTGKAFCTRKPVHSTSPPKNPSEICVVCETMANNQRFNTR
jgi:hypothetical protein